MKICTADIEVELLRLSPPLNRVQSASKSVSEQQQQKTKQKKKKNMGKISRIYHFWNTSETLQFTTNNRRTENPGRRKGKKKSTYNNCPQCHHLQQLNDILQLKGVSIKLVPFRMCTFAKFFGALYSFVLDKMHTRCVLLPVHHNKDK